jgi:hypothetical protein
MLRARRVTLRARWVYLGPNHDVARACNRQAEQPDLTDAPGARALQCSTAQPPSVEYRDVVFHYPAQVLHASNTARSFNYARTAVRGPRKLDHGVSRSDNTQPTFDSSQYGPERAEDN